MMARRLVYTWTPRWPDESRSPYTHLVNDQDNDPDSPHEPLSRTLCGAVKLIATDMAVTQAPSWFINHPKACPECLTRYAASKLRAD